MLLLWKTCSSFMCGRSHHVSIQQILNDCFLKFFWENCGQENEHALNQLQFHRPFTSIEFSGFFKSQPLDNCRSAHALLTLIKITCCLIWQENIELQYRRKTSTTTVAYTSGWGTKQKRWCWSGGVSPHLFNSIYSNHRSTDTHSATHVGLSSSLYCAVLPRILG